MHFTLQRLFSTIAGNTNLLKMIISDYMYIIRMYVISLCEQFNNYVGVESKTEAPKVYCVHSGIAHTVT